MALKHPIWTFFSPFRNDSFRALCLLCDTECDGGPRGTGGHGSGGKWWARDMITHLQNYHLEDHKAFRKAEFDWNAEKGGSSPIDFVKSMLEKEQFREALLELKTQSMKTESLYKEPDKMNEFCNEEFSCNMCPNVFKNSGTLNRHIRSIHKICELCGFESNKYEMKIHVANHIKKYYCKMCIKSYPYPASLKTHIETVHEGKRFKCEKCDHTSTQKVFIEEHTKRVHQAYRHVCTICKRKFTNQVSLDKHKSTKHEGQKGVACTMCMFTTAFKWKLKQHIKGKHEGELVTDKNGKFSCSFCDYKSKEKCAIRKHITVQHKNIKVGCDICPSTYNSHVSMESHKRSAHFGETFKCQLCPNKVYKRKDYLKKHMVVEHEGTVYPCKLCKYVSRRTETLRYHIEEKHTNPGSQKERVQCTVCTKTFRVASLMKRHLISHSDVKPISCLKCSLRFREPRNLKKHLARAHIGVRERHFICPDCLKTYSEPAHLKRHRLSHETTI